MATEEQCEKCSKFNDCAIQATLEAAQEMMTTAEYEQDMCKEPERCHKK